ncbi:RHS repeat-associated core domain-containing protein [Salmonella enterica]
MGENLAARFHDPIEHTSALADLVSTAMELGAYAAAGVAVAAAIAGTAILTGLTGGTFLAAMGAVMGPASFAAAMTLDISGAGEQISSWCEEKASSWFPPEICGMVIGDCSGNVRIKGEFAARAAGKIPTARLMALIAAENAPEEEEEDTDWQETAKALLAGAGHWMNPLTQAKFVMGIADKLSEMTPGEMLDGAWSWLKNTGKEFISPTVAKADPEAKPAETDKVQCDKNPFHNVAYIAQGSQKVLINSQPAARTDDLTTCEAKLKPVHPSRQVRIGGGTATVRDIRSGKHPVAAGIELISALLPCCGKKKLLCSLLSVGAGIFASELVQAGMRAAENPVHSATGIKVLGDEREEDFSVPGMIPVSWQRYYTSATEEEGILGRGWRLPFEMAIRTAGSGDDDMISLMSALGIAAEIGPLARGTFAMVPWMGFRLYRSEQDIFLMETLDGDYFLFEFASDNHYRLTQQSDRHQNRLYYRYNGDGRVDFIHDDSHSIRLHPEYRQDSHRVRLARVWESVSEPVSGSDIWEEKRLRVEYDYDAAGMLTTVRDATGTVSRRFTWNSEGLMTSHRYGDGAVYHYRWQHFPGSEPSPWRVSEHWTELDGHEVDHHRMAWTLAENRLTVTRENLGQRHWRWDDDFQVTEYTQADGGLWRYAWDENGNLTQATDPAGGEYRLEYDRNGNLVSSSDPSGRREMYSWHPHWGFLTSETDKDGNQWRYDYNKKGDRIKTTDPEGHAMYRRYDDRGLVTDIVDAKGNVLNQMWNERGQMTQFSDCSGYLTRMRYDAAGRPAAHSDARQQTTLFTYDALDRLTAVTLHDGRRREYRYTPGGWLESVKQPDDLTVCYRYNGRGQLILVTKPDGSTVRAGYDDAGRALWLENEKGERYAFEHDVMHRLIGQTDIGGVKHHWRYQVTGLVEEHRVEGVATKPDSVPSSLTYRYAYDASGRLLSRDNGETQLHYEYGKRRVVVKRFRHDELARAEAEQREAQPDDELRLKYDGRGLLVTEENRAGKHEHEYDPLGNLLTTTLPDGRRIENLYYGSGHLLETQLRDGEHIFQLAEYERDNLHREVHRRQGNVWRQTEYDVSGRVSHRRTAKERNSVRGITAEEWYTWDSGDRLTEDRIRWPEEQVPQMRVYRYDKADRIISVITDDHFGECEEEYRYDACGNLFNGTPCVANRLEEYGSTSYRYDEFGRLSRKWSASQDQRFEYDADSRLVRVENVAGTLYTQVEMEYDLTGRRTAKRAHRRWTKAVEETEFRWAGMRLYGEQQPDSPEVLFTYEEGSYAPLAQVLGRGEKTRVRWFRNGLNGSPEALTDGDGVVKWRQQWPARLWGRERHEVLKDAHGVMQNLRFQGQYLDRETGLHYNLFRYYDPDCGRFTQPDPINLAGGMNLYAYAPNPLGWIDPWGLCIKSNQTKGNAGRDALLARLQNSKRYTVIDKEVRIKTPGYGNHRNADIVVRDNKTGEIIAIETKTGKATRDSSQVARDKEIASMDSGTKDSTKWGTRKVEKDQYGNPTGISKGDETGAVRTVEVTVDPNTGKIL